MGFARFRTSNLFANAFSFRVLVAFAAKLPGHQRVARFAWCHFAVDDRTDEICDRGLDTEPLGQTHGGARRLNSLCDLTEFLYDLFQLSAPAKSEPNPAVA